jgi:hypothetical protein
MKLTHHSHQGYFLEKEVPELTRGERKTYGKLCNNIIKLFPNFITIV